MMDDDRSQEILENVEMVTHLPGEVVNLSSNNVIKDNEGSHEAPNDLINSQYINIHRVSDVALSKELVDCNSSGNTTLIGSDLLTHHVVHGNMVVDMMIRQSNNTNEFVQHTSLERALPQYIPVNESFETAEDILAHDLTEEDRSLAAALVAVQLVQQQKNNVVTSESNVIVSPSHLSNLHTKVPTSLHEHHISQMTPLSQNVEVKDETISQIGMVSTYMQTVDEGAVIVNHQEQQLLTPQHHHQSQPHTAHSHPHHNEDRILKMYPPIPSLTQLKKGIDYRLTPMKSKYLKAQLEIDNNLKDQNSYIKMESLDEELDEESEEGFQDDNDSDYDVENDLKTSRRSLPHKKRIPKKLKNPKKSPKTRTFRCTNCGEMFSSQACLVTHKLTAHTIPNKKSFGCELCGKNFINQLKFFEHLKSHYEPKPIQNANILIKPNDKSDGCSDISEPNPPPPHPTAHVTQQISNESKNFNNLPSLPSPISCHQCGKTFRRQKAFETHLNLSHPKEEINEFSDTEDMMEGIRVKVDSEEETDHLIISHNEIRSIKSDKVWYPEQEMNISDSRIAMHEVNQPSNNNTPMESVTELVPVVASNSSTTITNGSTSETSKIMERQRTMTSSDIKSENVTPLTNIFSSKVQYATNSTTTTINQGKRNNHGNHSGDLTSQDEEESQETTTKKKAKRNRRTGLHLTCTQCGRVFHHRNSLVYHLRSHSGERPHTCEICKKSFFAASALKVHLRLHSGDKPYKCEFCGRHFRQWGDLKYHCISLHSEEKNFQCEFCGKDFARKYSLIVHRRIHTGEKNYKCEYCEKTFRASSYLQNHRRIHTGEKPHPCSICGKPFRVRSDMKRHLNTHTRLQRLAVTQTTDMIEVTTKIESPDTPINALDVHSLSNSSTNNEAVAAAAAAAVGMPAVDNTNLNDINQVTEITIHTDENHQETILPDPLGESQPINLNIAVPEVSRTSHHTLTGESVAVSGDVLQYTRDTLDSVRTDGNNTLYIWPIYMT